MAPEHGTTTGALARSIENQHVELQTTSDFEAGLVSLELWPPFSAQLREQVGITTGNAMRKMLRGWRAQLSCDVTAINPTTQKL